MQRPMCSKQNSVQKRDILLKEKDFEHTVFKGEDIQLVFKGEEIQHIMWKDEESDSEHSASSSISDSEEDVPYVKKPFPSELDDRSQQSKEIVAEKRSQPSFPCHLHPSQQTVGEQSARHFVSSEDLSISTVKEGFSTVYCTDQIGQNGRRMLFAGGVVSDEFPSRTGLFPYPPGLVHYPSDQDFLHYPPGLVKYPCDQGLRTKSTRSMESLSTVAPCSLDSLPSMSATSFQDLPRLPVASMESLTPAALEEGNQGEKRHGKLRPCKSKRDRYRKLVSRLIDEMRKDPDSFDLESTELPPSLATDDKAKEKLSSTLQTYMNQARTNKCHHLEGDSYQGACLKTGSFNGSVSTMSLSLTTSTRSEKTKFHAKPKLKFRPCKGTRERHRKLTLRLKEAIEADPDNFDLDAIELPPSVASHSKAKNKLKSVLQDHITKCGSHAATCPSFFQ